MSNSTKALIESLLREQKTERERDREEVERLKKRFKESDKAKEAKEWAFQQSTIEKMRTHFSEFFLNTSRKSEVSQ